MNNKCCAVAYRAKKIVSL